MCRLSAHYDVYSVCVCEKERKDCMEAVNMASRRHFHTDFHPKARVGFRWETRSGRPLMRCCTCCTACSQNFQLDRTAGAETIETPAACKMHVFARRVSDPIVWRALEETALLSTSSKCRSSGSAKVRSGWCKALQVFKR